MLSGRAVKESPPLRGAHSEALTMRVFFVELHTLAVSIIGVLRRVVVPEIMPNVMPRMQYAMAAQG